MEKLLEKSNTGSRCGWFVGLLAVTLVASVSAAPNKKLENKSPDAPSAQVNTAVPMNSAQAAKQKAQSKLMSMPLAFEENIGQIEAPVKYVGRAKNYVVFLKPDGTVVSIKGDGRLQMKLQNANSSAQLLGEDRQKSYSNYYIGNDRSKWFEHVSQFGKVRYHNVYSGIDVVYHADERQIEYDFVVKPGTDPNQIRMVFEGADSMAINKGGDLELQTAAGTTINHKPVVYQMINGQRRLVEGAFTLAENRVSFKIGEYDRTQPLVIDPSLQVLAFFGGIMNDEGAAIAANNTCVCFTGRTQSASLPGGTRPNNGINWDVFVTALNPGAVGVPESAGTTVLWTTYLSGVGDQAGRGIAVDNKGVTSGNVYVAGYTNSSNFAGAALPANNYDAFVSILSSAGALSKTVLYGGPGADQALSIALDYSTFTTSPNFANITNPASDPTVVPNVVIGGFTNGGITPQPTGFQKNFNQCTAGGGGLAFCNHFAANGTAPLIDDPQGSIDGFVAEFNNGLTLLSATYLGGGGIDQVNGVAVDNGGNIYAAGVTQPGIAPFFPVVNGLSSAINGGGPGVANAGTNGGPAFCASPVGIAALGAPPAVLNGIPPCFQANYDNYRGPLGGISAFVVKFRATTTLTAISNDLKTLANSALFGGNAGGEQAIGIAVDQNGLPNTFTNPPTAFANPPAGQVSPSTVTIRPACFTFATPVPPAA